MPRSFPETVPESAAEASRDATQDAVASSPDPDAGISREDERQRALQALLTAAEAFADEVAARPNRPIRTEDGDIAPPLEDLARMQALGLYTAPLPAAHGGLGLGIEPGQHLRLLRLLAIIGSADLVLGRLYEGHVNALLLIATYGTPGQLAAAAVDAHRGLLFGVWNTGARELLQLEQDGDAFRFNGVKTFASGAAFVARPIVTAHLTAGGESRGWQMTLPRMDAPDVASAVRLDRSFWHPLGMEASGSYQIDFSGASITRNDLIGGPEDFYRDPLFRGGAIRFAAVQAGAVLRLHALFAAWLDEKDRAGDPYQIARMGELTLEAQQAVLWIERAAAVAEQALSPQAPAREQQRMIECANMTRLAIERIASASMHRVLAGVGAHGLLQPFVFESIVRNLTMYLRQPAPDQTLADVGRASQRHQIEDTVPGLQQQGFWLEAEKSRSLPPDYFDNIYAQSADPWDFETSNYEAYKYEATLASLPSEHYATALEVGCSIGVLTKMLAERCSSLVSVDISERALARARERCAGLEQVQFLQMQVPRAMPDGKFELIIVSEVAYYWSLSDLARAATLLAARQPARGHLVLVHFLPAVPDYPLTGDQVHEAWLARPEWRVMHQERHERFRLDVLERREEP